MKLDVKHCDPRLFFKFVNCVFLFFRFLFYVFI